MSKISGKKVWNWDTFSERDDTEGGGDDEQMKGNGGQVIF